jgi:threonine dehydrogenase-like Zn-dependent dehydrogenase
MKAVAVWPEREETGLVDYPEPVLTSPHGVCFRTLEVGVCGTDAEICSFRYGIPPGDSEYLVTGHEAIGQVEEVGADVSRFAPGDLVVPSVRRPCPHPYCPACRSGQQDFCVTGDYTERGIKGAHGFLAEHVVEQESYLFRVPPALRDVGVLTEPLTVAEKALRQYLATERRLPWTRDMDDAALLEGKRIVVLGAGPVGILGCMLFLQRGCRVWVYSRSRKPNPKAALVESIGAEYVSSKEVPFDEFAAGIGGVDLVYEAAGVSSLAFDVLGHLGPNGVLVLAGVPPGDGRAELPTDELMKTLVLGNQVLLGTVNANAADFEAAIRDLEACFAAWPEAVHGIITARRPLADFCTSATAGSGIKEVIAVEGAG